ncbi:MAG: FliH/SctL family protein [Polyangiaceae bacterium]
MGRVVKNAPASDEKYIVAPPVATTRSSNGHSKADEDDVFFADTFDAASFEPEPVLPPAEEAIDWPALHEQAGELLETAATDAEAILAEARGRIRTIVESAQNDAAQIAEQARTEGREAGYREGLAKAEQEMEEMLSTMRGLIDMARAERHKIIEGAEGEIVKLAVGVAERILHKAVEVDRDVVVAVAKAAIAQLVDRESVTVRVNPIDLERMKQHRDSMLSLGETRHMRVIEDQRVDPGGVIVETDAGSLDAKISTQFEEAKRIMRVEGGEVVVEPSQATLGAAS